MPRFISSVRFRLIALVLMAVIPAFGVILYSGAKHRQLTANQVQQNALGAARAIAAEQEKYIESAHQFLIMLAQVPQIRERSNKLACSKVLAGSLEPLYADFVVTDPKGNFICGALPSGSSLARDSTLDPSRVIRRHEFSVGRISTVPSLGKTVVGVGYPILDSPGLLKGVLLSALDLSWITRVTAENHLPKGATLTLVDANGTVLLRYPDQGNWAGKSIFAQAPGESIASRDMEKSFESLAADGVPRLFAFTRFKSPMGGESVYAGIDIPANLAFAEADSILVNNLITLGVLSAITLLAAWFGADVFVLRRIRDLVAATKQVAEGKVGARTQLPYGNSELGEMARVFDELAETLEKREAEAEASTAHIQQQRQRQKALYELNLAITSTLDLPTVLNTLLDEVAVLLPAFRATVSWVNQDTGTLEVFAQRHPDDSDALHADIVTEGLPLIVLKAESLLALPNAQIDPRTTNPEFFRRHRLVSYLGLPMISNGQALGVLSFYTTEEHAFNREEMDLIEALVNQAAIAVGNSRLYEQTRNQALELEKSNKIKDEFLGVMSHELRTPLNIIMNYSEALQMGTFGEISADQKKGTLKIRSQASHLLSLINHILEITKIESGTAVLQQERFDVADFISESRSDYMNPLDKDLTISWDCPLDLPAITSDRTKLKQILTNLVDNAIKFTEQGSVVVSIGTIDEGNTLELKVADTGPGIPETLVPFVFEKFRQIDSTTTRSYSGAGLGLYIVKTFTEILGGTVGLQSKLGEGSTFVVRLPIKREGAINGPSLQWWSAQAL